MPTATIDRAAFLTTMAVAARAAGHVWPEIAAIEAAMDSDWGQSELAQKANNVFNLRAPARFSASQRIYTTTVNGKQYDWLRFRTVQECFAVRMEKMRRLSMFYPALRAKTAEQYAVEVSRNWSADKGRAAAVIALHKAVS